jgi:WD40 repeat protein
MPKLQFMASGRMDGKLILWDTINSKKKWVYKEHVRGILSLAFNETMILLFSAGFDHKICIWNPYIPTLIHKIEGHLSPIFSLKVVENSHQLISMDSEGIVKITDTRRFNIISSFSVESEGSRGQMNGGGIVSCFITINKPLKQMLRLVFGGKSIWFYDYDKNYNPAAAD